MLNENIKAIRKSKGLSQEELAARLHVVRQTISKWETGLSVPDADLLIALSEALETPVSVLLGESSAGPQAEDIKEIAGQLEMINAQLANRKAAGRTVLHWFFILLLTVTAAILAALIALDSPYLGWDYSDPEAAVAGVALHAFEWLFVRSSPLLLTGAIVGICLTRKKGASQKIREYTQ